MYLFFDTETTGFARKGIHALDPSQARVCQLALLLTDSEGKSLAQFSSLIKPHGWTISQGAQKVHGFSDEDCERLGVQSITAFKIFSHMASLANEIVAHNLKFDMDMIAIEAEAHDEKCDLPKESTCTMLETKNICKIPGRYSDYKWPKLQEALPILCNREIGDDAHDAMVDTIACRDIFFALKEKKDIAA